MKLVGRWLVICHSTTQEFIQDWLIVLRILFFSYCLQLDIVTKKNQYLVNWNISPVRGTAFCVLFYCQCLHSYRSDRQSCCFIPTPNLHIVVGASAGRVSQATRRSRPSATRGAPTCSRATLSRRSRTSLSGWRRWWRRCRARTCLPPACSRWAGPPMRWRGGGGSRAGLG